MKRLLKKLSGSWTFMILSNANTKVYSLKIPKLVGYLFTLFIITMGTALFFTYQHANTLKQDANFYSEQIASKKDELKTLQSKYQTLLLNANKTKQKIDQLANLQRDMNNLLGSNEATGGEEVKIEHLSMQSNDHEQQTEVVQLQYIQQSIPSLVTEYKETISELQQVQKELAVLPSIWPTNARRITSKFGGRDDPFTRSAAFHHGLDIAGPYRSSIFSTADGKVTFAGRNGGYGNFIQIKHSDTYVTKYGHLSSITVEPGQKVKKGDKIGEMGSTGRSTGVHLHYEVLLDGNRVDPLPYILVNEK